MILICSPAELCKSVSAVVPAGVDRFIGAVGLNLPEEQKVPLVTHCVENLEAPVDKGFVRGRGSRRVREVYCVQGVEVLSEQIS